MKKQERYTVHKWTNPHLQHLVAQGDSPSETVVEEALLQAGAELKRTRTRQRVTQKQLSALTGIPQSQISHIENGREPVTLDTLAKLAAGLGKRLRVSLEEPED